MKSPLCILVLCWSIIGVSCGQSFGQGQLSLQVPTAAQEAAAIWQSITNISFFDEQGYQLSLPHDPLVDSLLALSRRGMLEERHQEALWRHITDQAYDPQSYGRAEQQVLRAIPVVEGMIQTLLAAPRDWDFKQYPNHTVTLTLYGPGGGYDPEEGSITLWTTPKGGFKLADHAATVLLHELVHLGIEASLVQEYNLSHRDKEYLVDAIIYFHFRQILPDYQFQPMGPSLLEEHITSVEDLARLGAVLQYVASRSE